MAEHETDRKFEQPEQFDTEHVVQLRQSKTFELKPGYDYLRKGFFKRLLTGLLRGLIAVLTVPFNYIAYGLTRRGGKNIRALRGEGAVSVCNHVHPMDCIFLQNCYLFHRVYCLSLESNFRIPFARALIRVIGAVPVADKPHCTHELSEAMTEALHGGAMVQVYPEGTLRPYCPALRRFHDGAFRLAVGAGRPVLPSVITFRKSRGLARLLRCKPRMRLNVLPAVFPEITGNLRADTERLRDAVYQKMSEFLAENERPEG